MLCALFWFFFSKTALILGSCALSALAASFRYSLTLSRRFKRFRKETNAKVFTHHLSQSALFWCTPACKQFSSLAGRSPVNCLYGDDDSKALTGDGRAFVCIHCRCIQVLQKWAMDSRACHRPFSTHRGTCQHRRSCRDFDSTNGPWSCLDRFSHVLDFDVPKGFDFGTEY